MKKKYIILLVILSLPVLKSTAQNASIPVKKGQVEISYLGEKLLIKPRTIDQLKKTALMYRYEMDSLLVVLNKDCKTESCKINFANAKKSEAL